MELNENTTYDELECKLKNFSFYLGQVVGPGVTGTVTEFKKWEENKDIPDDYKDFKKKITLKDVADHPEWPWYLYGIDVPIELMLETKKLIKWPWDSGRIRNTVTYEQLKEHEELNFKLEDLNYNMILTAEQIKELYSTSTYKIRTGIIHKWEGEKKVTIIANGQGKEWIWGEVYNKDNIQINPKGEYFILQTDSFELEDDSDSDEDYESDYEDDTYRGIYKVFWD